MYSRFTSDDKTQQSPTFHGKYVFIKHLLSNGTLSFSYCGKGGIKIWHLCVQCYTAVLYSKVWEHVYVLQMSQLVHIHDVRMLVDCCESAEVISNCRFMSSGPVQLHLPRLCRRPDGEVCCVKVNGCGPVVTVLIRSSWRITLTMQHATGCLYSTWLVAGVCVCLWGRKVIVGRWLDSPYAKMK